MFEIWQLTTQGKLPPFPSGIYLGGTDENSGAHMMKRIVFALVLGTAATLSVTASASVVDVTITGRVMADDRYLFDSNGIFGPTTNLLDGRSFTAVLRYDTSLGTHDTHPTEDQLFGGPAISPTLASPLVSASLSISSGAPVFFDGSYYSNVQTNVLSPKSYGVDVRSDLILSELFIFIQSATFMFGQVDSPVSYDVQPGDSFLGFFDMHDQFNNIIAVGDLIPQHLTVGSDAVSSTPLPATLPLFATGLGALGVLGWRRKRKAAALRA
jgi:hypothetical protein